MDNSNATTTMISSKDFAMHQENYDLQTVEKKNFQPSEFVMEPTELDQNGFLKPNIPEMNITENKGYQNLISEEWCLKNHSDNTNPEETQSLTLNYSKSSNICCYAISSSAQSVNSNKGNPFVKIVPDLITQNFEGPCKFGYIFPARESEKSSSVHISTISKQIFIRLSTPIVIQFVLDPTNAATTDLYIRATPKFSSINTIQLPVERCVVHMLEDDPLSKSHEFAELCKCSYYNLAGHVVRSQTQGSIYCYDPVSKRHSVLNPLKSRSHDIVYSFHCNSSCPRGIERRPLQVVFTLEQLDGLILGQASINVKISTCPKRDKDRHEKDLTPKNKKQRKTTSGKIGTTNITHDSKTNHKETLKQIQAEVRLIKEHLAEVGKSRDKIGQLLQGYGKDYL